MEPPHPGLSWMLEDEEARPWLERLPRLVAECADRWGLSLGPPYPSGYASLAMPAKRGDGEPVVLKVQLPDHEGTHEAEALRRHDGEGAIRLLDHDPDRWALLLERAEPGVFLSSIGPEGAFAVLIDLLPRLWIEADEPFTRLEDEAAGWARALVQTVDRPADPLDRRLLEEAMAAIEDLAPTQNERVLLNQDLHGDNVLSASREPWLMIDPKPLVGERAFGLAPIVRSDELGHSREHVVRRLDDLSTALDVDRERARRWTIAHTVAWGGADAHREAAIWLLDA